jgi:uncharacterized protein YciI
MFLLISRFTVPPSQVADQNKAHRAWVRAHADAGHFVAGGPEVPYQGAVIVAVGATRDELNSWIKDDPFVEHGLAQYDIREYDIVHAGPGAEALQG